MGFLTGHFAHIILFNYAVEPGLLTPYLPAHTEIDIHNGRSFISLVGVQCLDLHTYGLPLSPFRNYAQVNLRFYVRRQVGAEGWRHGVVFIRQLIPHRFIVWTARLLFNEKATAHQVVCAIKERGRKTVQVEYSWPSQEKRCRLKTTFLQQPLSAVPPAERLFFVERHWGYAAQRDGGCLEYRFDHPPWLVYRPPDKMSLVSVGDFFGPPFTELFSRPPDSVFACTGSAVSLSRGHRLCTRLSPGINAQLFPGATVKS